MPKHRTTMKIQETLVSELLPYAGNVMEHSTEQIADIANGIEEYGFNNPVLIADDRTIIAGHGRVLAAKKLGLEKVPCIVLSHLNEAQRRAYAIADNKIARKSTFNLERLSSELEELERLEISLEGLGFNSSELDALIGTMEDILPEASAQWKQPVQPYITSDVAEQVGGRAEPKHVSGELIEVTQTSSSRPKMSDDEYSRFELVMLHKNKQRLVSVMSEIREKHEYEKIEDALMHLVVVYEGSHEESTDE